MDIRRFFQPSSSKPAAQRSPQNGGVKTEKKNPLSSDEDVKKKSKNASKVKSSKPEEKCKSSEKKRKKILVIDSDSDDEVLVKKSKKLPKGKETINKIKSPPRKGPVQYVSETDSDSDNFHTLKAVPKVKSNCSTKSAKTDADGPHQGVKVGMKSPAKPASHQSKAAKSPVSPKATQPPQPKQTPTSVLDYFGNATVQRSEKKLVASVKRKVPTQDRDDLMSDKQMDDELEKQIHEDEEFARTLAMLDEEPQAKRARKGSEEKIATSPKQSCSDSPVDKSTPSKNGQRITMTQNVSGTSSKKSPAPVKTSSKLALMKKRDDERDEPLQSKMTSPPTKIKISPKKEPINSSNQDRKVKSEATSNTVKISPKKPESMIRSPDDAKRKVNATAYRNYLNRDGPRALGSKEIPQGADNCLEGCVFVLTGVLESMERDETKSLIERYGGKVTGNISKKTTYLVQGRDSGVSKLEKAESLGTKILDEDGLLELIRTKPGKKSKYEIAAEAESKASKARTPRKASKSTPTAQKISPSKGNSTSPHTPSPSKTSLGQGHTSRTREGRTPPGRGSGQTARRELSLSTSNSSSSPMETSSPQQTGEEEALLWVDKYRPRSLKAVIGQQGEQSCANKLLRWLQNWHRYHGGGTLKPPANTGKFGGKDNGSGYKAALLSGPPGVGKTTTASLVCEELGFSYVEMNASCTRSKNSLKEVVAESVNNTSIENFYKGTSQTVSNKHVLIMDEVDGMAGNEDRGGIQELIGLIKNTKIPIICMCNDRNHMKIRSLANHCFDLRFQRPRVEQIKAAMMSIAFKEGIKNLSSALNEIILASNQDVRQVLHNLSMWTAKDKVMSYDQCKSDAAKARKDMKIGPFEVCRKVFSAGEETARMSLMDKSDLFFHDYSLAPLFVQENYLHVRPAAAGGNLKSHLMLLSKTADSISDGDLVDRRIRSGQNWSLLPTQAIYASVLPGELMRGYMSQFPSFPSWLGKNSSTGKHSRIVQELASHMSLKTMSSRQAVNLDYLYYLRQALLSPLQRSGAEGASEAVQILDDYQLIKEDVDSIMEISVWGNQPDPYSKLDSKVKAAFTRAYNKEVHLTPYSLLAVKKSRRGGGGESEVGGEGMDNQTQESEDEEESLQTDAMIKQKKAKVTKKTKEKEDSGKRQGKAKAKTRK